MYNYFYFSYNSKDLELVLLIINKGMDNKNVVYIYNILFSYNEVIKFVGKLRDLELFYVD